MSISSGWSGSESESVSGMTSSTVQLDQSTRGSFYENENLTLSDSDLNLTLEERSLSTNLQVIVNVPFSTQFISCCFIQKMTFVLKIHISIYHDVFKIAVITIKVKKL